MFRLPILLLATVVLFPLSSFTAGARAGSPPLAPQPRVAKPRTLPIAPFPHLPGEVDLDLPVPEITRRIEDVGGPGAVTPLELPGILDVPRLDLPLPPGLGQSSPKDPLTGTGHQLGNPFLGRTGASKTRLLNEYGGNQESERAVALGLSWLAKQQSSSGSWEYDGSAKKETAAATGMALLAFLGAGETHKKDAGKYRKTVQAGLNWLLKDVIANGANAGKFTSSSTMYGQAIATLTLVEAFAMTQDPVLKNPTQAAVNYVQKAQAVDGSWGYLAGTTGDLSILGWQIQVLVAARLTHGLTVDEKVFKKAIEFLDKVAGGPGKATYGYRESMGASAGTSLTAVGLWCREEIDGWTRKNAGLTEGVEGLLTRGQAEKQPDAYFLHYASAVMRNYQGDEWRTWNEGPKQADGNRKGGMRDTLIKLQFRKDGDQHGSWDPDGSFIGRSCGRVGTTALCVVALEVYYRHLPPKGGVSKVEEPKKSQP